MFQNLRLSMAWLHTWFGLVLGFVLMAVFFFGALSVFDREIDRWAIPESRYEPQPMPSFDKLLRPIFEDMQPSKESIEFMRSRVDGPMPEYYDTVRTWGAYTTHRDPVLNLFAGYIVPNAKDPEESVWGSRTIDPRTGTAFPDDQLKIGSQFFYPLHYSLNFHWMSLGYWIVGFASLVMLAALVSGVIMHRKLFRELFTFRPKKTTQRSTLDLHNLTGVVALPFHFFFAFTGLVIFAGIYFPVSHTQLEPLHEQHEVLDAEETGLPHDRAGTAAPIASVDAMVAEAQRRWAERGMAGEVGFLALRHVGDANGYVSIYRAGTDRIALTGEGIHFKASTGEVLREDPPPSLVDDINEFLTGLHLQHFRHWLLRWLYVFGGLAGCVCIATGFIFFVEKRKRQHAKQGSQGARVVDALAVTTVTGMLLATLGILIANRLLPETLPDTWPGRGSLEQYCFWGTWVLAMAHAFWRSAPVAQGRLNPAWREQCLALVVLAPLAVLFNWVTTGDHLGKTLGEGYWPVAGLDLVLLVAAGLALVAARHLGRKAQAAIPAPVTNSANGTEVQHG
ncbi:PepSY-associated TM helix domain-containing protein [Cellvibrio japonicus]|uniref:PepSY domain protein n=1 Tax=Cellvibrio japonicus (strain Ueda107) TaxID=498211 RepID=B3PJU8_CELJU|nr:PepSY-associated TM helix domain-containing protein [Cellvibrio japonicus]ACE85148.1 PepSY domain protein [Cellvibrio japonicus Ueda107]QEI12730.1 PepSY domain-containing protein [Cellvibrio japonicus]QEI16304.1 PepSY domain-containing protein [Cellvibrio japonicus]QEI19882.1 PepSY domain-containing protein [Cellvibrio japonicus]